jgi:MFS family permease
MPEAMTTAVPPSQPATLTRREVVFLVAARFVGLVADRASTFMIPVAVYSATRNTTLAGVAFSVQWLPRVVAYPALGVVAEMFPMRAQLIATDLVRAAILITAVRYHTPSDLIIASGFLTIFNAHAFVAAETAVARNVADVIMPAAQAKIQTSEQLAATIGPALGGALLEWRNAATVWALVGGLFIAGGIATAALLRSPVMRRVPQHAGIGGGPARRLILGAQATGRNRPLVLLLLITGVVNIVGGLALAALPVVVVGELSGATSSVGIVASVASIASLLAVSFTNLLLRWTTLARLTVVSFLAFGTSALLMGLAPSVVIFGIAYAVWSAAIAVFSVWMRTTRNKLVSREELGATLGFFIAAVLVGAPVAGLLLSTVGNLLSVQSLILAATGVSAILCFPLWLAWRRLGGAPQKSIAVGG